MVQHLYIVLNLLFLGLTGLLKLHPCGPRVQRQRWVSLIFIPKKPGVDLEYCGYPTPLGYQTGILIMPNFVNRIVHFFFQFCLGSILSQIWWPTPHFVWFLYIYHVHFCQSSATKGTPQFVRIPNGVAAGKMSNRHVLWLSFFYVIGLCASNEAPAIFGVSHGEGSFGHVDQTWQKWGVWIQEKRR